MRHYECGFFGFSPYGRHDFENFGHGHFGHKRRGFAHSPERDFHHHRHHFGPRDFGSCRGFYRDHGPRHHSHRPCNRGHGPPHFGPDFGDHGPRRHGNHGPEWDLGPCGRRPPPPGGFEDGPMRGPFEHHRKPHGPGFGPEREFGSCGRRPPPPGFEEHGPPRGRFGHHGGLCGDNDFECGPSDFGPCRRKRHGPHGRYFDKQGPYEKPGCADCNCGPKGSRHGDGNPESDDSGNEGRGRGRRHGKNKPCAAKNKDANEGETVLVQRIVVESVPRCNSV